MATSPDGRRLLVSASTAKKVHAIDTRTGAIVGSFPSGDQPHENNFPRDGSRIFHASIGAVYTPADDPLLDATKGERWFQVVDANSLQVLRRIDMGQKLDEFGEPDMSSAVPMALSPGERFLYFQVSFWHAAAAARHAIGVRPMQSADSPLSVRTLGSGPRVVLVHGGIGPELSWERQLPLAERWTLAIPWRRGYEPSPAAERQDFAADADDLEALLADPAHVVGFSYGGLAAAIVAARSPGRVRSLTLIEPPLLSLAPEHPATRAMAAGAARFFGPEAADDLELHWAFLAVAGIERPDDAAAAREIERLTRMARRARPPAEATVDLGAIAAARIPLLAVSGARNPAYELICDLVAERTGGERLVLHDRPHAVQRGDGFNGPLEAFLGAAEAGG